MTTAPELRFTVLGPVRAWRGHAELDLGSPQQRAVLAVLLLADGRQVPASALVDALWRDKPPKAAAGTVRTYISQLRQRLRADGGQAVIASAGAGYALPAAAGAVDLELFQEWTESAAVARGAGDTARAAALLRDALELWAGEPLAGLPGDYALTQRIRLTELRLAAVEERLALDIDLGGHVAAATELRGLLSEHPLRERLSELLMLALYRAGRQAEALAVFGATRHRLSEELGIDPGPALQDIHQRILRSDERLIGPRPPAEPPSHAPVPAARARQVRAIPVCATSLVGRERAIAEVVELIEQADARLVTLTGPGGVGKSRLALAVARRLADRFATGPVFVPLGEVAGPELVLPAIGRAMGVDLSGAETPLETLAGVFGGDSWLLVMDNLEHLIQARRELGELLSRCPRMVMLTTSRTVFGIRGEHEYQVPPLTVGPSMALFAQRARAVRRCFALTEDNTTAVAEICRRLDGLPLAIELAAARTRVLDPVALLSRLVTSLDMLGTGAADLPERQRTLRASVEWSANLLADAERSLLETAAVFVGGWTLQAAAWVADLDEDRTLELTETLARHSLIQADDTKAGPRFRMLESVREYVAERLAARPDSVGITHRHAEYYQRLAASADLGRLQVEEGNLGAVLRWQLANQRGRPPLLHVLWLLRARTLTHHQRGADMRAGA